MRIADVIWTTLQDKTDAVYFVSGGGAMFLVDALGRSTLKAVAAIHEQGAGYMAVGHAMQTNKLAVCLTTAGPGATNAFTACAAAWADSLPVLFISGQAKTSSLVGRLGLRTRGVQELNIVDMARPITKLAYQPSTGIECIVAVKDMVNQCLNGRRGPCWLSVPLDVQGSEI